VLNKNEIHELCEKNNLLQPHNPKNIKYASYDLTVGEECRLASEKRVKKVGKNGVVEIPPYEVCFTLTEEKINLPNDVCALLFSRIRGMKEGFLMHPQPPIDPGFSGRLCILIHNLSNKTIKLCRGEHIASIVFLRLHSSLKEGYGSNADDKYKEAESLEDIVSDAVYTPALGETVKELRKTVENWRETFLSKWMPAILVIITILLMIITILLMIKVE